MIALGKAVKVSYPAISGSNDTVPSIYTGATEIANDGIDQDQHGDPDASDPHCAANGASHTAEEPTYKRQCVNGTDDDGDGYIDANDPGCEVDPYWDESAEPLDGFVTECIDQVDNDGDGDIDVVDLGCYNTVLDDVDGHLNDEAAADN